MNIRTRLRLAAVLALVAGLLVGDTAYPVDPTTSKAYVRQLERFGGKAPGVTIASLGIVAALVLFAVARMA